MHLRRPLTWLVVVGLASCGPESTELEPIAAPAEVESVDAIEEDLSFAPTALAAFDTTLQAPKCGTVVAVCDSGTLVQGRGSLGPELNAPNTIHDSCADGNIGTYQSEESLEALKVFTTDGTNFLFGKQVTVEAKVFTYNPDFNALDLYSAPNANSPVWTHITTLYPTVQGLQTLRTTFNLPTTGTLQAIRGVFRASAAPADCSNGAYDDRDDLVFAVSSGSSDATKPTTSLTAPAAGATVSGIVTVSASASDNVGVTKVEFYAGTTRIGTDTTAPYSLSWTTTNFTNGSYSITSRAYDAAGNVGISAARSVTVNNPTCGSSQNLLLNAGFEGGAVNWLTPLAPQPIIASVSTEARTGTFRAKMGGQALGQSWEMYQQITIPATACTASLRFWLKITTSEPVGVDPWDTFTVQIHDGAGAFLQTLGTFSNQNAGTGYVQRTYDLAAYKGQTIRINLSASEDYVNQTSFFVDDTAVAITR
jgi:hypothetical protein